MDRGNVDPHNGRVSDFEIVTVDVVAQPSAPNAYPKAIYEGLMNMKHGHHILEMARESGKGRQNTKVPEGRSFSFNQGPKNLGESHVRCY